MRTLYRIRFFDTNTNLVRCYGLSQRITIPESNDSITYYLNDIDKLRNSRDGFYMAGSDEARQAIIELLKVNGIFWVMLRPFEFNIKIENAFDWSDVHNDVIAIIKTHIFANTEVDVQDATRASKICKAWDAIASGSPTCAPETILKK